MRMPALLLALIFLHVCVVGQVVTFNYKNAPLEKVLLDISRQTGYSFHYQGKNIADGNLYISNANPVTAIFDDVELTVALKILFDSQPNYTFSVKSTQKRIVILPKPAATANTPVLYTQRGRVSDESGRPVEGVTISLKNGSKFTTTDSSGVFQLEGIRENDTLVITHVSFATRFARSKVRKVMELQVFPNTNNLDEVVVSVVTTGYQRIPERHMTGSFSHIDSQQFNRRISTSFLDRIENMSTGVLFSRNQGGSSLVGNGLVVRGISTIFGETRPLMVVDNFPYEGDPLNINPNDIESVTILKDAVATGLWGALAGNGVVIINTKRGNFEQAPRVSLVSNVTAGAKPDLYRVPQMSSADYMEVTKFLYENGYYNSRIALPYTLVPPDVMILDSLKKGLINSEYAENWLNQLASNDLRADLSRYFYRRSVNQQYAMNIHGGGNKMRYYFSVGYDRNNTNLARNYYERITVNASNTYLLMKDQLELTAGVAFAQSATSDHNILPLQNVYPYTRLADEHGQPLVVQADSRQEYKNALNDDRLLDWNFRPLEELRLADDVTRLTDYKVNLNAGYKLDFIVKGLKLTGRYQFGRGFSEQEDYHGPEMYFTRHLINAYTNIDPSGVVTKPIPEGGIIDINKFDYTNHSMRLQADYNRVFKLVHNLSVVAGIERRSLETHRDMARHYGYDRSNRTMQHVDFNTSFPLFVTPFQPQRIPRFDFNLGTTDHYLSYYSNLLYTFKYRYIFSFNLRKDESNLFGERINQHGTPLWSVGGGWVLSSEKWFEIPWLSEIRLRATHGYSGNVDKTVSPKLAIKYAINPSFFNAIQAFITNPANHLLQWERVRITNLAVDFAIRNNRISGTVEFYMKNSKDLVGFITLDQTRGLDSYKGNTADMKGKGFDVTLNLGFVHSKTWKWQGTLLYSYVTNRVTRYADSARPVSAYVNQLQFNPVAGTPIESIYAFKWGGLDPLNGNPLIIFDNKPTDQYDIINTSTDRSNLLYIGRSSPRFFGSYRNTITYKNLEFSFLVEYRLGYFFRKPSINYSALFQGFDFGHPDYTLRWRQPGDEIKTNVPSLSYPSDGNRDNAYLYSDILVERGDRVRLQDVQLSYTISKSKVKGLPFQSVTFNAYINNIGIIWKAAKVDIDPDYVSEGYRAPLTTAAGIQVNF